VKYTVAAAAVSNQRLSRHLNKLLNSTITRIITSGEVCPELNELGFEIDEVNMSTLETNNYWNECVLLGDWVYRLFMCKIDTFRSWKLQHISCLKFCGTLWPWCENTVLQLQLFVLELLLRLWFSLLIYPKTVRPLAADQNSSCYCIELLTSYAMLLFRCVFVASILKVTYLLT